MRRKKLFFIVPAAIVGITLFLFLGGGSNEGMFGITYEVGGTTSNPKPIINPISAIAPGVLRKFFEFRAAPDQDRSFADPTTR